MKHAIAATGILLCLAATASTASADEQDDRRTPVVRAVEQAAPSVVNISTKRVRTVRRVPFGFQMDLPDVFRQHLDEMFPPRRQVTGSLGSGVIISPNGYIVTNLHVIQQADEIVVTLADESQHSAEVVSADPGADLAIIKIEADQPLKTARMGTSSDLMIGETVIAVGNPFGYRRTVTTGVVSALDRELLPGRDNGHEGFIQTYAPINPGNSGGPLLNIRGQLIGINTAIRAGAQGLGFAIPVDRVREIMLGLLRLRRAGQGWLGLHLRTDHPQAVVVARVETGSPAEKAGLRPDDRIESLDGRTVENPIAFETGLLDFQAGDVLTLGVRQGDRLVTKQVTLATAPEPDGLRLARAQFGLQLQALTEELAATLGLQVSRGLLVAGVDPAGPAQHANFAVGDVIIQVDRYRISDAAALGYLLDQVEKGDRIVFYVVRGRSVMRAVLVARCGAAEEPV